MNKFLAKVFTPILAAIISGCANTPPATPYVTVEPRQVVRPVEAPRPVAPQPQVKKITTVTTYDCLLDAAGNRTTDCIVVSNGTTKPRDSVRGTKEEIYTPAAKPPNGTGPHVFASEEACRVALRSGDYRNYEPKYFGGKNKNPVVEGKNKAVPSELDACVDLDIVGGRKWVIQKAGTIFRFNLKADGSLEDVPFARDDCGNKVHGIAWLLPEKRTVPGDWIRRHGLFTDEVVVEEVVVPPPPPRVVRRPPPPQRCCIPRPRCIGCCPPPGYGGGCSNGGSYQSQESYRGSWSTEYYGRR